jgi:hypothetical protein
MTAMRRVVMAGSVRGSRRALASAPHHDERY